MSDGPPLQEAIGAAVRPLLDRGGVPGAAVALSIDGQPLAVGVGFADAARTVPLAADAPFYLYSITKTLIAAAALRLADGGVLDLDLAVGGVLGRDGYAGTPTLRQLLAHTGGLPDYGGMAAYHEAVRDRPGQPWTPDEFLARTLPLGPRFSPGEGWAYSNIGHLLVRLALERATGRPLAAVLDDLVVAPLGLRSTRVAASLDDGRDLTPGYDDAPDTGDGPVNVLAAYHPGWVSHGTVRSTVAETVLILDALVAGELLRPDSLEEMLTGVNVPGEHPPFVRPGYGLGVMLDPASPFGRIVGHGGGGPGHATAAFHFPEVAGRRLTVAALVNRGGSAVAQEIAFALPPLVAGIDARG